MFRQTTSLYVDTQSARKSGAKAKVWLKWIHAEPVEVEYSQPRKTYKVEKALAIYNCAERTTLTLQVIDYAEIDGGEVVFNASAPDSPGRYTEVAPETIGESILNFVCRESSAKK